MSKPKVSCIYIDENLEQNTMCGCIFFDPASIQEIIIDIQNQYQLYDEIKFTKVSKIKTSFYSKVLSIIGRYKYKKIFFQKFKKITLDSYQEFIRNIIKNTKDIDFFIVFVDYFGAKKGYPFEQKIIEGNEKIIFCLREDSKSNKLLQLTDLILGCETHKNTEILSSEYKKEVLEQYISLGIYKKVIVFD